MRERSAGEVLSDLLTSGMEQGSAQLLSQGAGLSGSRARNFISRLHLPEISPSVEGNLFSLTWSQMEKDVTRLVSKQDVVEQYGQTDWEALNPAIKEMVVDLRFRGDYTPRTRSFLQESIVENDLPTFAAILSDRSLWQGVPRERFEQRASYINSKIE